MFAANTQTETVTIETTVHAQTSCLILDAKGTLGEPMLTGRSVRIRTVVHADGTREVLTVDTQYRPGGRWSRRKVSDPFHRSYDDCEDECDDEEHYPKGQG